MALFKKGDAWYIDYYVDGKRKHEAVALNCKLAESALAKRKVQVAENKFLDVVRRPKTTFEELARTYAKDLLKFSEGHLLDSRARVTKQHKTISYYSAKT
jgi:hypothetical protein